jgi:ABC-2 type transport system permease protein
MTTTAAGTTTTPTRSVDETLQVALASGSRPDPVNALSASLTFGWRALLKIKHVPQQLMDVTAFPIMFTLIFTYLFGGALAGSPSEYLQFFLPGILVQTVAFITMYTGVAINTDISKGVFDRFRSLPIWRPSVLVGALFGDVVRYAVASIVVLIVGIILGYRPDGGILGVVLAILLLLVFAFSLTWIWTILGLKLRTPESVMQTSITVLFPLVFATNIFVETDTMPGWLQAIVKVNPISQVVDAVRGLMEGDAHASDIGWALLSCAVIVAVFAPITMRLYNAKIRS